MIRKRLTLMTYNIHSGIGRDRRYELERVAAILRAESPDVIALQEVNRGMQWTKQHDQPRILAELLGMNHYFCRTSFRGGGEWGIALLSPFTIVHRREFDLTYRPKRKPRFCLRVDVEIANQARLHVFNCHLGLTSRERLFQRRQMLSDDVLLAEDLKQPTVLMGDFNDRPVPVVHRRLRTHFADAFRAVGKRCGPTFAYGLLRLKLDHIYVSSGIRVLNCWVRRDESARMASDHLPVISQVEVEWPIRKRRSSR
jgi:endonuclease/exonuclease/phosphatase family metal-dependent hydrolase